MSNYVILGTAHGVNVAGKRSPDGKLREYAYSREICDRVKTALEAHGVACEVDVPGERETSLTARVQRVNAIAKQHPGSVYVSIHNNAAGSDGKWHTARGFCVYVSPNASSNSKRLATIFHKRAQAAGLRGNRAYPSTGHYVANLYVCRATNCPAVLTENLFQDNREDVAFLLSDDGKAAITQLHVDAILEYLGKV